MKIEKDNPLYIKASIREGEFWEWNNDYEWGMPKEIQSYINRKKHWSEEIDDFTYLKSLWYFENGLSIGSGWGEFELKLIKEGIVGKFRFLDISKKAHEKLIKNAKEMWISEKIETEIQDFNFLELEKDRYDIISCQSVLHHLINLEEALFEINKSLKPTGIFVVDDFIGERKMYRSNTRIAMLEVIRTVLKEKYAIQTNEFIRTSKKVLTNNCPFECVRSNEVYGLLQYYFWDSKVKEAVFWHIMNNYWWIMKTYDHRLFEILEEFDEFAAQYAIVSPVRVFGVYKKSDKMKLENRPRSDKEVKKNIRVNRINEKSILLLWQKIMKKMPRLAWLLKKLYFMMRW